MEREETELLLLSGPLAIPPPMATDVAALSAEPYPSFFEGIEMEDWGMYIPARSVPLAIPS